MALRRPEDTRYCLGSVLNHVVLHQTVIGQEAVISSVKEVPWTTTEVNGGTIY